MPIPHKTKSIAIQAALLTAVAFVFVLVRTPLLRAGTIALGWNSDAAIIGLMQRRLFTGQRFPVYFFGQSYMGPLTAFFGAFTGGLLRLRGESCCGALALRTGAMLEVAIGIAFYWAGLRLAFNRSVALLVAFWLTLGPYFHYLSSLAPIGGEIAFTVSGLLFWFASARLSAVESRWTSGHIFLAGLLCGFGWWMNQGCVFVIAGALAVLAWHHEPIRRVLLEVRPLSRLLLSGDQLGWRSISRSARLLLAAVEAVPLALLALALLPLAGLGNHALFWEWPLGEPLVLLSAFHLIVDQGLGGDLTSAIGALIRTAAAAWRIVAWRSLLFVTGVLTALLPVAAGRLAGAYPRGYGLSVPVIDLSRLPSQLSRILRQDLWRFLGVDRGMAGLAGAMAMASVLAFLLTARTRETGRGRELALATIVFSLLFYCGSSRATNGAVRYMVAALPLWMAFFGEGVIRLWNHGRAGRRTLAVAAALAYSISLGSIVVATNREIASGGNGEYAAFPGNFDPRPVLQDIESRGYRICYANYWIAYKLQWLSEERVRFIPYLSYDRLPDESALLRAAAGPKCYVDPSGNISEFAGQPAWSPKRR